MTLITFQDGKPVLRDGKVGTEQGCCCGGQCPCVCICPAFQLTEVMRGPSPFGPIPADDPDAANQAAALLETIMNAQQKVLQGPTGNFTISQRNCEGGGPRVQLVDDENSPFWTGYPTYWVFFPELVATCCGEIENFTGQRQWFYESDRHPVYGFRSAYDSYETCTPNNNYPAPYTSENASDCYPFVQGQKFTHPVSCRSESQGDCVDGGCNPLP